MATQAPSGAGQNPAYRPAHRHTCGLRRGGGDPSGASRGSTPSTTRDTTIGRAPAAASNGECDRPGCDNVKRAMGFIWLRARAELRVKWRAFVVLAVVVGLGGGVALAAFAGARRTDAAMPQFVAYSQPDDGGLLYGSASAPPVVTGEAANSLALAPLEQRIVDLPQVVAYFRAPYLFLTPDPAGHLNGGLNTIGASNADLLHSVDRPLVIAGRLPDPHHPFDVAVNELAAEKRHLHVGSRFRLYAYSAAQFQNGGLTSGVEQGNQAPDGPTFTVRVTAIVRSPQDVNAVNPVLANEDVSYEGEQNLFTTPAFLPRLAAGLGIPVQGIADINFMGVRLRHGAADWKAFSTAANALGHGQIFTSAGNVYSIRTAAASAERGIHLEVVALLLFGALAALVTLLLVGQAIARQVMAQTDDYRTLRSLGATASPGARRRHAADSDDRRGGGRPRRRRRRGWDLRCCPSAWPAKPRSIPASPSIPVVLHPRVLGHRPADLGSRRPPRLAGESPPGGRERRLRDEPVTRGGVRRPGTPAARRQHRFALRAQPWPRARRAAHGQRRHRRGGRGDRDRCRADLRREPRSPPREPPRARVELERPRRQSQRPDRPHRAGRTAARAQSPGGVVLGDRHCGGCQPRDGGRGRESRWTCCWPSTP